MINPFDYTDSPWNMGAELLQKENKELKERVNRLEKDLDFLRKRYEELKKDK